MCYLFSGRELERPQGALEVSDGLLEVEQSLGDARLQLGGSGVGGRVSRDLDQVGSHGC